MSYQDNDLVHLQNPGLPPQELARIAEERPDLWNQVLSHPQIYPELSVWITSQQGQAGAQPPQSQKAGGTNKKVLFGVLGGLAVLAVVAAILFFAMGGPSNKACVGTWQVYSLSIEDGDEEVTVDDDDDLHGLDELVFVLESDGTGLVGDEEETFEVVWKQEGDTCLVTDDGDFNDEDTLELHIVGDDLVLEESGFVTKLRRE